MKLQQNRQRLRRERNSILLSFSPQSCTYFTVNNHEQNHTRVINIAKLYRHERRLGGSLFWVLWGVLVWGVGLAVRRFLCADEYIASLIKYEWGGPQHPAHGGVKSPGILFMTWRAQGVMNGWLLVFLFKMCCHKAS